MEFEAAERTRFGMAVPQDVTWPRAAFDGDEVKRRRNDDKTGATPGLRKLAAPRETFGTATSMAQHSKRKRKKTGAMAGKTKA
ncbi:hypothetical protein E2562_000401 [Oryza meyeriana var. granulata]|uniref:Uncharacterized protein n=1 Tax=Oryza meyeriana var. granulata TaxID=110450 RepID=A0A6G1CDH8_9ORYZ|nr:hypothetical protein E2562_000401 [Oryza meyeriana var. granulata]